MTKQAPTKAFSADAPVAVLESIFPFLADVYSCQSELPPLVAAERELLRVIACSQGALAPDQKLRLIHTMARAQTIEGSGPFEGPGDNSSHDIVLATLAHKLSSGPPSFSHHVIRPFTEAGLTGSLLVEAVSTVGIAHLILTLAKGFEPDFECRPVVLPLESKLSEFSQDGPVQGPHLKMPNMEAPVLLRQYSMLREQYGFVPNLFHIQSYSPECVKAQVNFLDALLFSEDHLSRVQKELIVLRLAALNANTYLVTMQLNVLGLLGIGPEKCDQIIESAHGAGLSAAEEALLEEVGRLCLFSGPDRKELNRPGLRNHGFTEPQLIEAVATAAFTNFLTIVQFGLDPVPDFPPRRVFTRKDLYPLATHSRPTFDKGLLDPDSSLVAQVKAGNNEPFAELVRRHTRRVFGTLAGMLGNADDARDSTQDVFLKAFQNIARFQGRSKFSTWITSIAVNTGMELLRQRKPTESLDDSNDESNFRPRQIQSWVEDPEQQLAKAQINDLVRQGVRRLPEKYRIAILLRDINQIPTEEVAAALDLSVPALKARVLRGRLMLRESLAPHFSRPRGESDV